MGLLTCSAEVIFGPPGDIGILSDGGAIGQGLNLLILLFFFLFFVLSGNSTVMISIRVKWTISPLIW